MSHSHSLLIVQSNLEQNSSNMQLPGKLAISFLSLCLNNGGLSSISRGRIQFYILPPMVQVFPIAEINRSGFSIMPVDTITLELPAPNDSILFHKDLVEWEKWFPAATYLLQHKQRKQKPGESALPAPSPL